MAAPCAGADIPRWRAIGHWGQATCQVGLFGASAIGVMAGSGLAVADVAGPGVAGAVMAMPEGLGVNPQEVRIGTGLCGVGAG